MTCTHTCHICLVFIAMPQGKVAPARRHPDETTSQPQQQLEAEREHLMSAVLAREEEMRASRYLEQMFASAWACVWVGG